MNVCLNFSAVVSYVKGFIISEMSLPRSSCEGEVIITIVSVEERVKKNIDL